MTSSIVQSFGDQTLWQVIGLLSVTWLSLLYKFTRCFIYFLFLSDEGPMLETLDYTIRIGSTPTILYFDLYLYSADTGHYVYINLYSIYIYIYIYIYMYCLINEQEYFIRYKDTRRKSSVLYMIKHELRVYWMASKTNYFVSSLT